MKKETIPVRRRVGGVAIGCPVTHNEPACMMCGGGWPGTKSPSEEIIKAVEKNVLNPDKLGCVVLVNQVNFLIRFFKIPT